MSGTLEREKRSMATLKFQFKIKCNLVRRICESCICKFFEVNKLANLKNTMRGRKGKTD